MNRRRCAAAAIALVCALSVSALQVQAMAAPAPPGVTASSPDPTAPGMAASVTRPGPDAMAPAAPVTPNAPYAGRGSLEKVREEIDSLYLQAGAATDAYNLAEEQSAKQSAEIVGLAKAVVAGQAKIADLRNMAGAQAREQYRNGGLPPGAQLLLSDNPQLFLDGVNRVQQSQQATKGLLAELTRTQEDLERYTRDAGTNWKKLEANRVKQAAAKKKINERIAAAKKLESQLAKDELAGLHQLEEDFAYRAQAAWLGSGVLKEINRDASASGRKAVSFATAQIGKPYVWGAEGPRSYDCSGLTSQAWATAGTPIPRTSQEQWRQLPHIAIKDMRPGDLIIYHGDASHVGMYVGDGVIVHAPRPGRNVTLTGAGTMRILGVVRPDS
ncbi:NlpC/P60 family protein [Streptomyces sp. DT24]|uniref:C40 family peptidase n=1 Tax=Streptomyces sp. DT24 TaxID=3416520 RepID=UPI003CF7580F